MVIAQPPVSMAHQGRSSFNNQVGVRVLAAQRLEDNSQVSGVQRWALVFTLLAAVTRHHFKIPKLVVTAPACQVQNR